MPLPTQLYYKNLLRKDLIIKTSPLFMQEVPEFDRVEVRIFFPKIIDDYDKMYDGILYLEELTGQKPIKQILSIKRVSAHDYERSVLVTVSLRKERIFRFFIFLYFALIYYWEESKNVLIFKSTLDAKNKMVQLKDKEFFYFFNMPIEYDDRQYEWNFQILFYFTEVTRDICKTLLGYILSPFLPYSLFDIKRFRRNIPIIES